MDDSRYPKLSFLRLLQLAHYYPDYTDNWYLDIKQFFDNIERTATWQNLPSLDTSDNALIELYRITLHESDLASKAASSSLCVFPLLNAPELYSTPF